MPKEENKGKGGKGGRVGGETIDPLSSAQADWIKMSINTCKKKFTDADSCNAAPGCIWKEGGTYGKKSITYPAHCSSNVAFPM